MLTFVGCQTCRSGKFLLPTKTRGRDVPKSRFSWSFAADKPHELVTEALLLTWDLGLKSNVDTLGHLLQGRILRRDLRRVLGDLVRWGYVRKVDSDGYWLLGELPDPRELATLRAGRHGALARSS